MNHAYLYAIDLGNGEVKVGRTKQPKTRMKQYSYQGYNTGEFFVSVEKIKDACLGEKKVCLALDCHLVRGREYFNCNIGVAIEVVKSVCEEIGFYRPPQEKEKSCSPFLRPKGAAEFLGEKPERLSYLRKTNKGPKFHRDGMNGIIYITKNLIAWVEDK